MDINTFLNKVDNFILNPIILLLFAVSFVYFLYGIVKFLRAEPDDKGTTRTESRNAIMWGLIGMLIMFSVYGIIRFVLGTFGISPSEVKYITPKL